MTAEEIQKAEADIYKRDFTAQERKDLASKGHALPNGSYPIATSADLHPAAVLARSGHGDTAAAKALIARRAKELGAPNPLAKAEDVDIVVAIRKAEAEQKIWGIVLDPTITDSQGDDVSAEEIEKAAHDFMVQSRKSDVQHDEVEAGVQLLESYLAPQDLVIEGQPVAKGAWVMAHKVLDAAIWDRICKGELTGYSIGGTGVRVAA